uniref:Antibiotic biosynthesis monooxygenase n=1 Tax=Angiostrongylus costaricensis TaxID=334426 RepID=A0A0R3Q2N2_ANGCS
MRYDCLPTPRNKVIVTLTRWDSDLEAFSHNPPDLRTIDRSVKSMNQMSEPAVPLVLSRITIATICQQ